MKVFQTPLFGLAMVLSLSACEGVSFVAGAAQAIEYRISESYRPLPNYLYLNVTFWNPTEASLYIEGTYIPRYHSGNCELGFDITKLSLEWVQLHTDANVSHKIRGCNISQVDARLDAQGATEILLPAIEFKWFEPVEKSVILKKPYLKLPGPLSVLASGGTALAVTCLLPRPSNFYRTHPALTLTEDEIQFTCSKDPAY